jgi:hypothetical protein
MATPVLIIDNHLELDIIEKQCPWLKNAPIILLSSSFSPQLQQSFEVRGFQHFDEKITKEEARRLSIGVHHLLWHWFLDENGKDLSKVDGFSLGLTFVSSMEILLNTLIRYQAGLSKLLKKEHTVYYSSKSEDIFLDTIVNMQKQIGFELVPVDTRKEKKKVTYGRGAVEIDANGRKRDLKILRPGWWWEKILIFCLNHLQRVNYDKKKVLLMPAGKMDSYFEHVKTQVCSRGFQWIVPFSGIRDLLKMYHMDPLFYHFSATGSDHHGQLDKINRKLKDNLKQRMWVVDVNLLIRVMERHTFVYFLGALSYFNSSRRQFRSLRPDLVIFSAESYENFIIAAQAARCEGIKTAFLPHGIYGWGYAEYKAYGRYQVFDHCFAFGKVDAESFRKNGVEEERITITSIPHLEKFLPLHENKREPYRRVLCLPPDYTGISPLDKINGIYKFFEDVSKLLENLDIELIGIKTRNQFEYIHLGIDGNTLNINGREIPLLSGYKSFPEAAEGADMIIGPVSTAIMEAGLMGKDYYVYQHTPFHEFTPSIMSSIFDFVNASFSMNQLKDSILKRQPYKPGCSFHDLVGLEGVKTKENLFQKFESGIESVLESK